MMQNLNYYKCFVDFCNLYMNVYINLFERERELYVEKIKFYASFPLKLEYYHKLILFSS